MPNGGSDCCASCWFNRANNGTPGIVNTNPRIPSFCKIRDLAIPDPGYTYCANHPYRRPKRDAIPIGPVYVHVDADDGVGLGHREFWKSSPDTEEIRQHLLDLVETPNEHRDGYPFYSLAPHLEAIEQLVEFADPRVVDALENLYQQIEGAEDRSELRDLIKTVRQELDQSVDSTSETNGQEEDQR